MAGKEHWWQSRARNGASRRAVGTGSERGTRRTAELAAQEEIDRADASDRHKLTQDAKGSRTNAPV